MLAIPTLSSVHLGFAAVSSTEMGSVGLIMQLPQQLWVLRIGDNFWEQLQEGLWTSRRVEDSDDD